MLRFNFAVGLAAAALATLALPARTQAHIQMDAPVPRFLYNGNNNNTGPCASGTASTMTNAPLTGGSTLTVRWHETINHDGHYRIGLSANESDFTVPMS